MTIDRTGPRMTPFSLHCPCRWLAGACFSLAAACVSTALAGYGEQALRGNMLPEPYFRTEDGRTDKRGADALVNRYRLYDFYRRQADDCLSLPGEQPTLLPPFPGLDGGRRGHWGATNEKDTTALVRRAAPDFTNVTGRNRTPLLYVRMEHGTSGPLLVYDAASGGLQTAYAAAEMSVPEHAFDSGSDRFGFALTLKGEPTWSAKPQDGWTSGGKAAAEYVGYALHGQHTILRRTVAGAPVMELPALLARKDGEALLVRQFEFPQGMKAASELQLAQCPGFTEKNDDGNGRIVSSLSGRAAFHAIHAADGLKATLDAATARVTLTTVPEGGRIVCLSWHGNDTALAGVDQWKDETLKAVLAVRPSTLLKGGPSRLGPEIAVKGTLNADPEARGTAYEMDDVPVPGEQQTRMPMTLSGLAFDKHGVAFVSTLVGDIWRVTGLNGDLQNVRWKRFAAGINLPIGLQAHDGAVFVTSNPFVLKLTDLNDDGEADLCERFSRQPMRGNPENGRDLIRHSDGSFHTHSGDGIWHISADGARTERIGGGARNPLGLGLRADGLTISDSSEGESGNGTCTLYESTHAENARSAAKQNRLLYLPRGVDNSPGSRLFLDEPRFGPLGHSLIGLSYGTGSWYYLVRDLVEGTPQAALVPMPGLFLSGATRLAVQPADGQIWVAGLDGWGDYAITEGSLHRLRYTGKPQPVLAGWRAHSNALRFDFSVPIAAAPKPAEIFIQQWNYVDSEHTYGSLEMSVLHPDKPGHDRLTPASIALSTDRKSLTIALPGLLPAMCTHVRTRLATADGAPLPLDLYCTLQRLDAPLPGLPAPPAGRPLILAVPSAENNGDTYQKTIEHFDKLAGRETVARAVTPDLPWKPEQLTYEWLKQNVFATSCNICHAPGTQHDYTTRQGLMAKVRLDAPEKSPLIGMMKTGTMPPYPLPSIAPSAQKAVLEWIRRGAPEK
jgi:hypothetical protein